MPKDLLIDQIWVHGDFLKAYFYIKNPRTFIDCAVALKMTTNLVLTRGQFYKLQQLSTHPDRHICSGNWVLSVAWNKIWRQKPKPYRQNINFLNMWGLGVHKDTHGLELSSQVNSWPVLMWRSLRHSAKFFMTRNLSL